MASLCRVGGFALRRVLRPSNAVMVNSRCQTTLPDPYELATGPEKIEMTHIKRGNTDPFNLEARKRGPGTKDQPNLIPSAFGNRFVGCVCDEDCNTIRWMNLDSTEPKRCYCGHWFKIVDVPSAYDLKI